MSLYLRRLCLILLAPLILIGFSVANFVWWLMEGNADVRFMWEVFMKSWKG